MRHEFHPEAAAELIEAVRFYQQRSHNLGVRFAGEIRATIRKTTDHPTRWRMVEQDIRRCLAKVFPYAVLYTIESDHVLIIAIAHGKRQPGYWRHRLLKI